MIFFESVFWSYLNLAIVVIVMINAVASDGDCHMMLMKKSIITVFAV